MPANISEQLRRLKNFVWGASSRSISFVKADLAALIASRCSLHNAICLPLTLLCCAGSLISPLKLNRQFRRFQPLFNGSGRIGTDLRQNFHDLCLTFGGFSLRFRPAVKIALPGLTCIRPGRIELSVQQILVFMYLLAQIYPLPAAANF